MDSYEISLFIALVIILSAVVALIGFLMVFFLRRQNQYRARLKEKATSAVNLLEAERSRLAMDLHDDVRPLLTASRLHLMLVKQGGGVEHAAQAFNCMDELGLRLEEIACNLSPRLLALKGLQGAIDSQVKLLQGVEGMNIGFAWLLQAEPEESTRVHLFRIVQELLHNAVKHAAARRVQLIFEEEGPFIRLQYFDNGRGFSCSTELKGMGLGNLRSRVELLDGYMDCRSEPGQGTYYLIEVPNRKQNE